ncbi:MAG: dihydrofolate reductase [bacterium]|nr:dihydrofolate reductase [bacterium]MDY2830857.1 dihydrofolate reductase [Alphaproteobacteria bacterium]
MTKIAVWCRHDGDNLIGIGAKIPWHIPSDFRRFRKLTESEALVVGEKTYESFPNRTLPNRDIHILTLTPEYEVSDPAHHFVHHDIKDFKEFEPNLYICGGATIYKLFMSSGDKLMPDVIVDCKYLGAVDALEGPRIDITPCIETMEKKYLKMSPDYEQENVLTSLWVKKGDFVDQGVLKKLINIISVNN